MSPLYAKKEIDARNIKQKKPFIKTFFCVKIFFAIHLLQCELPEDQ